GDPRALSLVGRAGLGRGLVGNLGRRFRSRPGAIDDCVSRDGVQPGSACAPLRAVARGGSPDRRERLLGRVFGAAPIAEPSKRQCKNRSDETAVEDIERLAVADGDALQQFAVGACLGRRRTIAALSSLGRKIEGKLHLLVSTGVHAAPDCSRRPPSTTSEVPVTNPARARKTTASATSSGEPMRPRRVSAARRSVCSGSTATGPGATPHTRTSGASARAKTRVSIACAALAAECAANEGQG